MQEGWQEGRDHSGSSAHTQSWDMGTCTLLQKHPRGRLGNKKKLKRIGETLHFGSNSQSRKGPMCFGVPSAAGRCHQISLDQSELGIVMQRHQIVVNEINLIILELDCPLFPLSSSRDILWSSENISHEGSVGGCRQRKKPPSEMWDPTAESLGSFPRAVGTCWVSKSLAQERKDTTKRGQMERAAGKSSP